MYDLMDIIHSNTSVEGRILTFHRLSRYLMRYTIKIFEMICKFNLFGKDLRISENLYWAQTDCIQLDYEFCMYIKIENSVTQGCGFIHLHRCDITNSMSEFIIVNPKENTQPNPKRPDTLLASI